MNESRGQLGGEKWRENMKYQIKQAALNALFSFFFLWSAWRKYPDTEVIFFVPLSICFAILAVLAGKLPLNFDKKVFPLLRSMIHKSSLLREPDPSAEAAGIRNENRQSGSPFPLGEGVGGEALTNPRKKE